MTHVKYSSMGTTYFFTYQWSQEIQAGSARILPTLLSRQSKQKQKKVKEKYSVFLPGPIASRTLVCWFVPRQELWYETL